jgi:WD40 repeat protein
MLRRPPVLLLLGCSVLWLAPAAPARADDKPKKEKPKTKQSAVPIPIADLKRDRPVDFQAEVLPVLRRSCIACHNSNKAENHLVLETPQTILKGGESGPAVVPKHSADSLLLTAAAHLDDPTMPPPDNNVKALPLSTEELGLVKLWIDQGATGQVSAAEPLHWRALPATVQPILSVAVSADGELAACGRGEEIYVYELESGATLARLVDPALVGQSGRGGPGIAHLDIVQALAFQPGGDLLASSGFREAKLWRRPRNVRLADLAGSTGPVRAIAVSRDGKLAATGEAGGLIRLWELPGGKPIVSLTGHSAAVTGLRFTPEGAKLVSASADKTIRVWNVPAGTEVGKVETPTPIGAMTLVRGGTQVCTGHADGVIRIWAMPGSAIEAATKPDGKKPPDVRTPDAKPATAKPAAQPDKSVAAKPPVATPPAPLKELKGHTAPVTALDIASADGLQVLSGSDDATVRGWNIDNGQQTRQVAQNGAVTAVAVSPNFHRYASAGVNNSVRIWNYENNQQVAELRGDFRTAGKIRSLEQNAELARSKAAELKQRITEAEARVKEETDAIQKAKDGKTAAEKALAEKKMAAKGPMDAQAAAQKELDTASAAAKVAADKAAAAKTAADKDPKKNELTKAADDAKRLAAEADQKVIQLKQRLDDITKNAQGPIAEVKTAEAVLTGAAKGIETTELSAKKAAEAVPVAKSAVDAGDASLKQAEAGLATAKGAVAPSEKTPRALAFSADSLQLAIGGDDHLVQIYSAESGGPTATLEGSADAVLSLAFAPSGGLLAGAADKSAILWNTRPAWSLERTIGNVNDPTKFVDRVLSLDFSPDGKLLATGGGEPSRSGELKLWNPVDGALVRTIADAHSDAVCCVRFSRDGTLLASSATDRFMKVFNVATGALVKPFEGHTHHVLGVAWRADGKVLATCGADNVIKAWDLSTGEQQRTIEGFAKEVTSITYLGTSPRVLVALGERAARIYNLDNGGQEKAFGGPNDFLYSVAATPDGKEAVGGGQDSVLRVWNIENSQQVREFDPPK